MFSRIFSYYKNNKNKNFKISNYYNDIINFQYHYNNSDKNNDKEWINYFKNF